MFTPTNIATPEEIFKACTEIQGFLEAHYEADNGDACVERGQAIENYMALTSKLLADAKHHEQSLLNSKFINAVKIGVSESMSASTLNKYLDTLVADYTYLVNWCERLNKSCTHSIEFLRTIISKLKQEMYNSQRSF